MQYTIEQEGRRHVNRYDDVQDYLQHLRTPVNSSLNRTSTRNDSFYPEFTRTKNLEEALELAEAGWPEGLERVAKFSAQLNERITGFLKKEEMLYDVTGDVLDIGRFVAGEPEDFGSLKETEVTADSATPKIVNVVMNIATSASMSQETMELRGAACIALCDALEKHGKRTEIDMVFSSSGSGNSKNTVNVLVRLKEANEPLQMDKLAFILAHPAGCRRLAWASVEHMNDDIRRATGFDGAYAGCPCDSFYVGDIIMEKALGGSGWTFDQTLEWILRTIEAQGITVVPSQHERTLMKGG